MITPPLPPPPSELARINAHSGIPRQKSLAPPLSPLSHQLLEAIRKGRPVEAERLLSRGADPLAREGLGDTPLLAAVSLAFAEGSQACVRLLASKGGLRERDATGKTPLLRAVSRRIVWAFEILAYPGWESDADAAGNTAALLAAHSPESLAWLLAHGCDSLRPNRFGRTPLMAANYACAQLLLSHPLPPNADARDNDGQTALMHAAQEASPAHVALLLRACSPCLQDANMGATALHWALMRGNFGAAELLASHVDLSIRDSHNRTPLMAPGLASSLASSLWPLLSPARAEDIDAYGMREALLEIQSRRSPNSASIGPKSKFEAFLAQAIYSLEEAQALSETSAPSSKTSPRSRL